MKKNNAEINRRQFLISGAVALGSITAIGVNIYKNPLKKVTLF